MDIVGNAVVVSLLWLMHCNEGYNKVVAALVREAVSSADWRVVVITRL